MIVYVLFVALAGAGAASPPTLAAPPHRFASLQSCMAAARAAVAIVDRSRNAAAAPVVYDDVVDGRFADAACVRG